MDYYEPRDDLDPPPWQDPEEPSPIQKVYDGSNIFITGATGFMGRVLMEKILRTCNVARIYILVRDKKGVKSTDRLTALFDDMFFEPLKMQKPGEVAKVSVITGDCCLPDLGLSEADKAKLADVNIIFHAAATLYMDQHLRAAYITNIVATKSLLKFAETLPRLQAFMYISTAYTHAYRDHVEESFYNVVVDEDDLEDMCSTLDDVQIGALTPKVTGKWGNTYALTKACAENVISKYDGILPIGIVRPSIVVSTWAEPVQGWINNVYGAMGVVVGTSLGVLRVWCCDSNTVGDMIPVDIAINMTLAATWEVITKNTKIKIYNCVSSPKNPIKWNILEEIIFTHYNSTGLNSMKAIAAPYLVLEKRYFLFYIYTIWYHIIPAIFIDTFLKMTGKSPLLLKVYIKLYNFNILLMPYCIRKEIVFLSDNVNQLWETLDAVDKTLFNFDLKAMNWDCFWLQAVKGGRVYLTKDPMETLREGEKHRFKLQLRKFVCDSVVWMSMTALTYYFTKDKLYSLFIL